MQTTEHPDTGPWSAIIRTDERVLYYPRDQRNPPRVERTLPSGEVLIEDLAAGYVLKEEFFAVVDLGTLTPKGRRLGDRAVMKRQTAGASWFRVSRQEIYDHADRLTASAIRLIEEFRGLERVRVVEVPHRDA